MALSGKLREFFNKLELQELASKLDPYITHPVQTGSGTGDMTKAVYDPDDDGLVAPEAHTHTESDITDLGAYLTTETDPVFTAWDKDYGDLINTPTIPVASDVAYDATSWNGNTDVPTKNAIRDKLETMGGGVTLSDVYPVGSIYISIVSTNPGTLFGMGTWVAFGAGKVLVGLDAADESFDAVEETGGAKTHTLGTTEIPSHRHLIPDVRNATTGANTTQIAKTQDTSSTTGTLIFTDYTGGGQAHNNLQPYIVVYMWKRTA